MLKDASNYAQRRDLFPESPLKEGEWYNNDQNRIRSQTYNKMIENANSFAPEKKQFVSDNPLPNRVAALEKINPMAQ